MRKYYVDLTDAAFNDLSKLPPKIQRRILDKLDFFALQEAPLSFSKKLSGSKNTFRFRIGDYRVVFWPEDNGTLVILLILKIAHRREVYE